MYCTFAGLCYNQQLKLKPWWQTNFQAILETCSILQWPYSATASSQNWSHDGRQTSKLHSGPARYCSDPIVGAVAFCPEANATVNQAKAKETEKRGAYINIDEKMAGDQNRKVFEWEHIKCSLAPPTTSWKVILAAGKIKSLSQYEVWVLGEIFIQRKFCCIWY